MIAWVQGHGLLMAGIMFVAGVSFGFLLMAVLVSGKDPAEVRRSHWMGGHW